MPIDDEAAARDRAPVARHAAHRQPPAAARARLRAGARRRPDHRRRGARRDEAARSRRPRLRRSRPQAAAHDHRQVQRRPGRRQQPRRRHQRREGCHRGYLRAVPDPGGLSRSHAARPRRHARAPTNTSGSPPPGGILDCGNHARRRARLAPRPHLQPRDLRAAARAHQRRSRTDGRHLATSGSCSGPASASGTSSIPASPRRISRARRRSRRSSAPG